MKIELRPIQINEAKIVYDFFKSLPRNENGSNNEAFGMSRVEFDEWIKKKIDSSKGIGLKPGYVPDTTFILFIDDIPVGESKLRHALTSSLMNHGGNIGYAIAPEFRGKGYANIILSETLNQAKTIGLDKVLISAWESNIPSWKTIECNGGLLENNWIDPDTGINYRRYWIDLS